MTRFDNIRFAERVIKNALVTAGFQQGYSQQPRRKADSKTLPEIAQELQLELVNVRLDRGVYQGICMGLHSNQALVKYRSSGAMILDIPAIDDEQKIPRLGDVLHIEMSGGRAKITVVGRR